MIANDTPARLKAEFGSTIFELAYRTPIAIASGRDSRQRRRSPGAGRGDVAAAHRDSVKVLGDVLPRLERPAYGPVQLLVRDPSLDDVFLALTGQPYRNPQSAAARRG